MGLAAIQHGLLVLQFTSFNGAVNGGNEGENLISGIFCCSYGVWLVVTHPVRCVWLPTAPTAFWQSVGVWTPWTLIPPHFADFTAGDSAAATRLPAALWVAAR